MQSKPRRQDRRLLYLLIIAVASYSFSVFVSTLLQSDFEDPDLQSMWEHSPPARPFPVEMKEKQRNIAADHEPMWVETLSEDPRIVVIHNMLTHSECDHLIELAKEQGMEQALIQPYGSHELVASTTRTNTQAWLQPRQDAIVASVENRISQVSGTKWNQGENLQVLSYKKTQQFEPHHDFFDPVTDPPENFATGGNRMATIVIYLQAAEEGGETDFPQLDLKLALKKGDAVLWKNLHEGCDGTDPACVDRRTEHAGLPPRKGEKWVATKWIHERAYSRKNDTPPEEEEACFDRHPKCTTWEREGQCSDSMEMASNCPRACGFCIVAPPSTQ